MVNNKQVFDMHVPDLFVSNVSKSMQFYSLIVGDQCLDKITRSPFNAIHGNKIYSFIQVNNSTFNCCVTRSHQICQPVNCCWINNAVNIQLVACMWKTDLIVFHMSHITVSDMSSILLTLSVYDKCYPTHITYVCNVCNVPVSDILMD